MILFKEDDKFRTVTRNEFCLWLVKKAERGQLQQSVGLSEATNLKRTLDEAFSLVASGLPRLTPAADGMCVDVVTLPIETLPFGANGPRPLRHNGPVEVTDRVHAL